VLLMYCEPIVSWVPFPVTFSRALGT
jgi:hypothetical protein